MSGSGATNVVADRGCIEQNKCLQYSIKSRTDAKKRAKQDKWINYVRESTKRDGIIEWFDFIVTTTYTENMTSHAVTCETDDLTPLQ